LKELVKHNKIIVDLEHIAKHKGSAFGAVAEPQPNQETFENLLAQALADTGSLILDGRLQDQASNIPHPVSRIPHPVIYLEDESQRIGNLQIPMPLWFTMRKAPVFFMDIPFEERLDYITGEYGKLDKQYLQDAIVRIQKRLGGLEAKNALQFLEEDNYRECFRILLSYYDKWYHKGLYNRENITTQLNKIPCTGVDTAANIQKLLSCNVLKSI
jgi:tRNA 2-selenouridine synthase